MDFSASQVLFNASSLKLVKFLTLCCMYSWEKECISYKYVRCVPKIWSLTIKEICDFFTLKMLPMALELIRAQNLLTYLSKTAPILQGKLSWPLNSLVKWTVFYQWVKKVAFLCFDQCWSHWKHFRVKISHVYLEKASKRSDFYHFLWGGSIYHFFCLSRNNF